MRHGAPLLPVQQQRGVQHHGHFLSRDMANDGLSLFFAGGNVGELGKISAQFFLHLLRHLRDTERGGIGDLPFIGERTEKHRIKMPVRENLRVPDLIAAGENHIIGQFRRGQLLHALKPVVGDAQVVA